MSRRTFIQRAVATAGWFFGLSRQTVNAQTGPAMLTILHTNDIHAHVTSWQGWDGEMKGKTIGGSASLATAINRVREDVGDTVLLLDAGDLIGDTMIEQAVGQRVVTVEHSGGNWELDQLYRVATNSMLAKGGHNQRTLLQGKNMQEHGAQFDAIKLWITRNSPIRTPKTGRISQVSKKR
jgi:2',3'-cyclic-nucleotide 2'-phosphodiesterase (5'-nucleotidase family)